MSRRQDGITAAERIPIEAPEKRDAIVTRADAVAGMTPIDSFEEISEILRSRKFVQGSSRLVKDTLMKNTIFLIDGEEHLARKRLLARMLDDNAVAGYRDRHLLPAIERCLAEIAVSSRGQDGVVRTDLTWFAQRCMHRVAAALTGIDGVDSSQGVNSLMRQLRIIVAGKTVDWSLEDPRTVIDRAYAAYDEFRCEFFEPSFQRRLALVRDWRARGEDPDSRATDMLTLMAAHRDDIWKGDDDLVMRDINTFLTASTQSSTTAFVLYALRVEQWFATHPVDREQSARDPAFLRRAAFESLRVSVSPPARMRIAGEDLRLSSGREVKAGETLALFLGAANRESARFGDHTGEFDPYRHVADGTARWGLSFGAGAHACPGRPLITGSRNPTGDVSIDGTMVALLRRLHEAGMTLDPQHPPQRDPGTHYEIYSSVPVLLTRL